MPRDNSGNYSLPSGSIVNTGDTIEPSQHNPPLQDIASALSSSLSRDGFGAMRANFDAGGFKAVNLADGTANTDAATFGQILGLGVPVGGVLDYAGAAAPTGWLLCYGQTISRSEFADLFTAIGTAYGAGDGSTTFNVPDARGRVSAGKDDMGGAAAGRLTSPIAGNTLGASGGAQSVTLAADQMPPHTHSGTTGSSGTHTHSGRVGTVIGSNFGSTFEEGQGGTAWQTDAVPSSGAHTHSFTTSSAGSGSSHSNVQPTLVFNKIIRASAG